MQSILPRPDAGMSANTKRGKSDDACKKLDCEQKQSKAKFQAEEEKVFQKSKHLIISANRQRDKLQQVRRKADEKICR